MKTVIYRSKVTDEMGANDVGDILLTSRMNNQRRSITGALLYRNGYFLQILEGKSEDVDDLVRRIRKDKRHTAFTVLFSGEIGERAFPDWSMARVPEDAVARSPAVGRAFEADQLDSDAARQFVADISKVVR